jgi:hypothetical protein
LEIQRRRDTMVVFPLECDEQGVTMDYLTDLPAVNCPPVTMTCLPKRFVRAIATPARYAVSATMTLFATSNGFRSTARHPLSSSHPCASSAL